MGVKGLWQLLEPVGTPVTLDSFEQKIVAVDISIWLHQAIHGADGQARSPHLAILFRRLCKLIYFRIRPVFVFDGPNVPLLKKRVLSERRARRQVADQKLSRIHQRMLVTHAKRHVFEELRGEHPISEPAVKKMKRNDGLPVANAGSSQDLNFPTRSHEFEQDDYDFDSSEEFSSDSELDIDPEDFEKLSPSKRRDFLLNMKESMEARLTSADQLPEVSQDFSSFQINRVCKRRKLTEQIDNLGKYADRLFANERLAELSLGSSFLNANTQSEGWGGLMTDHSALSDDGISQLYDIEAFVGEDGKYGVLLKEKDSKRLKVLNDLEDKAKQKDGDKISTEKMPDELRSYLQKSMTSSPLAATADIATVELEPTSSVYIDQINEVEAAVQVGEDAAKNGSDVVLPTDFREDVETLLPHFQNSTSSADGGNCADISDASSSCLSDVVQRPASANHSTASKHKLNVDEDSRIDLVKFPFCEKVSRSDQTTTPSIKDQNDGGSYESSESDPIAASSCDKGTSNDADDREHLNSTEIVKNIHTLELAKHSDSAAKVLASTEGLSIQSSDIAIPDLCHGDGEDRSLPSSLTNISHVNAMSPDDSFKEASICSELQADPPNDLDAVGSSGINPVRIDSAGHSLKNNNVDDESDDDDFIDIPAEEIRLGEQSKDVTNVEVRIDLLGDDSIEQGLANELNMLRKEYAAEEKINRTMTDQIYEDCQDLLRLFGMPYIVAPGEAEAQCSWFDAHGMVYASITDDSDAWLFGGQRILKNVFNRKQQVESYCSKDITSKLGLSRRDLCLLALLSGCDYTDGVRGIGIVTGVEIISEFSRRATDLGLEPLERFWNWWKEIQRTADCPASGIRARISKLIVQDFPPSFPNREIYKAFMEPRVDESEESFSWGKPNVAGVRDFILEKLGWTLAKIDEMLGPVIQRWEKGMSQMKITSFLHAKPVRLEPVHPTKRLQIALDKLSKSGIEAEIDEQIPSTSQEVAKPLRSSYSEAAASSKNPEIAGRVGTATSKKVSKRAERIQEGPVQRSADPKPHIPVNTPRERLQKRYGKMFSSGMKARQKQMIQRHNRAAKQQVKSYAELSENSDSEGN